MTCISEGPVKSKFCSPSPATQQPQGGSSGSGGPQPMGTSVPGMGNGARPQLSHSQPSGAWMLFLDARARNSSPAPVPSIRPLFHGNQHQQPSPAQPVFYSANCPVVPIATSDQDVGCLVEAGREAGTRFAVDNTHSLVVSGPSLYHTHY